MNKHKVIVFTVIGILVLGIFLIIYNKVSSGNSNEEETSDIPLAKKHQGLSNAEMIKYKDSGAERAKSKINVVDGKTSDTLNFSVAHDQPTTTVSQTQDIRQNPPVEVKLEEPIKSANRYPQRKNTGGAPGGQKYKTDEYTNTYNQIKTNTAPVSTGIPAAPNTTTAPPRRRSGFIDQASTAPASSKGENLQVITFGDQLVKNGGGIKLRVTNEATIQNIRIPRNTVVYGLISQSTDRMEITVSSIMVGNTALQVEMIALDAKDGGKGMRLAKQDVNADSENVRNQASDEALGRTGVYSVPIIGTLTRGAKDLLTRRRNNNEILVTDNYKLILK